VPGRCHWPERRVTGVKPTRRSWVCDLSSRRRPGAGVFPPCPRLLRVWRAAPRVHPLLLPRSAANVQGRTPGRWGEGSRVASQPPGHSLPERRGPPGIGVTPPTRRSASTGPTRPRSVPPSPCRGRRGEGGGTVLAVSSSVRRGGPPAVVDQRSSSEV